MGATLGMLHSGAVEAAAGTVVSIIASSFVESRELQEEADVILHGIRQEVLKIQCAVNAAGRRHITDRHLLEWLASLIDAVHLGNYYHRIFNGRNWHPPMIDSAGVSNITSPFYRPVKRQRTFKNLILGHEQLKELKNVLKKLKNFDICTFMLFLNPLPEKLLRTYLHTDHNRLIGRDKEKDEVMNFLFNPSTVDENNVDILPIIGSKAIGKTSLVLHCLHDPKVQSHFSVRIYTNYSAIAYPAENYQIDVFEYILRKCKIPISNGDESTLIGKVKQIFSSVRILLVLDGIARVDSTRWNALLDCVRCGSKGSKIIVTGGSFTEDGDYEMIATLGMVKPITLGGFREDNYMFFFKEHAFGGADPEDYPELEKIGREIATQMDGSIWKAKIFGELLRDNLDAQFWSKFLQIDFMNLEMHQRRKDLFPVLCIIARMLPAHLKVKTYGLRVLIEKTPSEELKSFRELMVLGPDHCMPLTDKHGKTYLEVFVTKHIFHNICTIFTGKFYVN